MTEKLYQTTLTPELYCTNIKDSLEFYLNILGFNIQYQREESKFAMLERQGSRIMLEEISDNSRTWISAPLERPFGRGINLQIETNEIDSLYHKIQKSNFKIFLTIEDKRYRANDIELVQRQFIVLDPDGYMLRFVQMT